MNFLDAHKIVHGFADAVAEGCEDKDDFFISVDKLHFHYDKDLIVSAFQIFISHMILYKTRTKEEFEQYKVVYMSNISRFMPYNEILKFRKYSKIIGNKNFIYKILNKDKIRMAGELYAKVMKERIDWDNPYRIDDIFYTTVGEMQEYKIELFERLNTVSNEEFSNVYDEIIDLYARKAYELANIEYKDDYFYCFQDFDSLREALKLEQYKNYYKGYEDYIMTNK
jgi:hypothetical protein